MVSVTDQWIYVGVFMIVNLFWSAFASLLAGWWVSTAGSLVLFAVFLRLCGYV